MKNKLLSLAMLVSLLAFGLILSACGPSAATQTMLATPTVEDVIGFKNKLLWLKSNAQNGGNYLIEVKSNEQTGGEIFSFPGDLSYKNKSNITITIRGVGKDRVISRGELGNVFTVGAGVTLILDNITLHGTKIFNAADAEKTNSVVRISSEGTLVMNEGVTITGNSYHSTVFGGGGGVYVSSGGTFIMKGGLITGNECFQLPNPVLMMASKGKANTFSEKDPKGCGVYVAGKGSFLGSTWPSGTFIKTSGTITGYASNEENGNVVKKFGGQGIVQNNGHAIYANGKSIDITIGPNVHLSLKDDVFSGNWDGKETASRAIEKSVAEEPASEETASESQSE